MSEPLTTAESFASLDSLAYALGRPSLSARLKQEFVDFRVDEVLGFAPTGAGEHLYLRVRKTDLSTTQAARLLAESAGVAQRDVGYSGMKDRRGECTQWFSLKLPQAQESGLAAAESEQLQFLESARNNRKLRVGSHRANQFRLTLRQCEGPADAWEDRLRRLTATGVPNYFGAQRFGREMSNLEQVRQLFQAQDGDRSQSDGGRQRRGMLYSAARAYLFNQVLSQRLGAGNWATYVPGDVLNLDGTERCFTVTPEQWDATLQTRLDSFDIHITGPLPGLKDNKDRYASKAEAADIEDAVCEKYPDLLAGLRARGIESGRRPLRFMLADLSWEWQASDQLQIGFTLPRGAYATSLLRELCLTTEH